MLERPPVQKALSRLAVTLGCFVGFAAFAEFGMATVPLADGSPEWSLRWFGVTGLALLGLSFLVGSLVALRNRRPAGMVFLTVMPAAAFCLAYPDSGFLVWRDNGGWYETATPAIAIGLAVLFYGVLLPPFCIWPRKKRAAIAFAFAAAIAVPIFGYSRWTAALLPRLAAWSMPFVLLGLFWLRTDQCGWPPVVRSRQSSLARRALTYTATCVGILCLDVFFTLTLSGLGSSLFSGDCKGRPPFLRPRSPAHAVFTAKILFAGRSIESLARAGGGLPPLGGGGKAGDWAIGVVGERFWGMPGWTRLVLLTNYIYWQGETYFVDGRRFEGFVTQFLPMVEGGINCSRTKPIQNAGVDLRLLRKPPAPGATHVIGYVRGPETLKNRPNRFPTRRACAAPNSHRARPGASRPES